MDSENNDVINSGVGVERKNKFPIHLHSLGHSPYYSETQHCYGRKELYETH